jgi:hypothetical protein
MITRALCEHEPALQSPKLKRKTFLHSTISEAFPALASAPTTKNTIDVGECLSTIKAGERILELIVSIDCAETLSDFNSIIQ